MVEYSAFKCDSIFYTFLWRNYFVHTSVGTTTNTTHKNIVLGSACIVDGIIWGVDNHIQLIGIKDFLSWWLRGAIEDEVCAV